jgi:acyl dehydratase
VATEDLLAPPTFATCFTIGAAGIFSDPELGFHWNLVHGSQELSFSRPVRGGDLLACTPWIVDIADRERFEIMTFQIDVIDARTGEDVLEARAHIIFFKTPQEG